MGDKSTTNMLNVGEVAISKRNMLKSMDSGLLATTTVGYEQGIKDFLAKPVIFYQGIWSTQTVNQILFTGDLPQGLLSTGVFADKVRGFLGFRATIVLRLQVNANKFQQGKLLMHFLPCTTGYDMPWTAYRNRSLLSKTQQPGILLDACCDTEVLMEIPYVSPNPFYNLIDQKGGMGSVYISVYNPLLYGTGVNSASITLWASFKDVEIVTPTYYAQVGDFIAQAGGVKQRKKNVSDEEADSMVGKPISSGLMHASKAAASFAQIPLISAIAGTASWVLGGLSGAAAAFGFSKPSLSTPPTRMSYIVAPYANNADASDTALPMGLSLSNKVDLLPGFAGTDMDEMNINYLVQMPYLYTQFAWTTSSTVGSSLFQVQLDPAKFCTDSVSVYTDRNIITGDGGPMWYLSNYFKFWRGSIKFTFRITKTNFHSGRLLLAFFPGISEATALSAPIDQTQLLMREIIDVREGSEWTFTIPFASTRNWHNCREPCLYRSNSIIGYDQYGILKLYILNELTAPDTVAQSVVINVEVSGGPDMEFAVPRQPTKSYLFSSPEVDPIVAPFTGEFTAQVGELPDSSSCAIADKVIGSGTEPSDEISHSRFCIGEQIKSVNQLLKRETQVSGIDMPGKTIGWVTPDLVGATGGLTTGAYSTGVKMNDYFTAFSWMYRMNRGSIRYRIYPSNTTTPVMSAVLSQPYRLPGGLVSPVGSSATGAHTGSSNVAFASKVRCVGGTNNTLEIAIPQYSALHSRLCTPWRTDVATGTAYTDEYYCANQIVVRSETTPGNNDYLWQYRSVGDDFQLGYFIGCPILALCAIPTV